MDFLENLMKVVDLLTREKSTLKTLFATLEVPRTTLDYPCFLQESVYPGLPNILFLQMLYHATV